MSIPIRTLSPQDAEILARTIETGVVSGGCVECHGLRWRSDFLRTWEIEQRSLGRRPEVSIRIDELDLAVVFVESLVKNDARKCFRATSTQPRYTTSLSLFEHSRMKAALKRKGIQDRLIRMTDERAFNLRIEYHAALGRANDPIAYRRLVQLRDELASLRVQGTDDESSTAVPHPKPPSADPEKPAARKPDRGRPEKPAIRRSAIKPPDQRETPAIPETNPPSPPEQKTPTAESAQPPSEHKPDVMPVIPFPQISIKRKPK